MIAEDKIKPVVQAFVKQGGYPSPEDRKNVWQFHERNCPEHAFVIATRADVIREADRFLNQEITGADLAAWADGIIFLAGGGLVEYDPDYRDEIVNALEELASEEENLTLEVITRVKKSSIENGEMNFSF